LSTLDSALELARASIPVFPVELTADNKKRPLIKWRDFASTDPETARQLFSQDYQLGQGSILVIGVPTGTRSGFDAVDIDPRHGGDVELYHETLPDTRWHDTRQGGRHYLFNHLDGMRNSTSKIEPAIDVRGEDGFIVWWPAHGGECHTALIADWPGWLAEMATKPRTPKEGAISLDLRKPPSACHVVDLLNAMQNRLETTRDTYVEVMLAAKGCIDALDEAGELTPEDDLVIADAATGWAERGKAPARPTKVQNGTMTGAIATQGSQGGRR